MDLKARALAYHQFPRPGKLSVEPSKVCETAEDLALAYTPGVAEPVREIHRDPENVYRYTNKGNLVAVITNGSAILGLGNLGALAAKPVMEGKAVLFKRFADIDVFDIEIDAPDTASFIETVVNIAPTFGGINLEDIAAPNCFEIEAALRERLDIPVFHDDQHGTAVIICAGLINALEIQQKRIEDACIVCLGAGAAGLASMRLAMTLGADPKRVIVVDSKGVISKKRKDINKYKQEFALDIEESTLSEAVRDADVFIGVSGANLLSPEMLLSMAPRPIVFALANPEPEILPSLAHTTRKDLLMATGRSDFPNQVNNVLGFPFIFRGALDARAKKISQAMLIAAVRALSALAKEPVPQAVLDAYAVSSLQFGADYILPKPFDPRLREYVSSRVQVAAEQMS